MHATFSCSKRDLFCHLPLLTLILFRMKIYDRLCACRWRTKSLLHAFNSCLIIVTTGCNIHLFTNKFKLKISFFFSSSISTFIPSKCFHLIYFYFLLLLFLFFFSFNLNISTSFRNVPHSRNPLIFVNPLIFPQWVNMLV